MHNDLPPDFQPAVVPGDQTRLQKDVRTEKWWSLMFMNVPLMIINVHECSLIHVHWCSLMFIESSIESSIESWFAKNVQVGELCELQPSPTGLPESGIPTNSTTSSTCLSRILRAYHGIPPQTYLGRIITYYSGMGITTYNDYSILFIFFWNGSFNNHLTPTIKRQWLAASHLDASSHGIHPVRDTLNCQTWDEPRIRKAQEPAGNRWKLLSHLQSQ